MTYETTISRSRNGVEAKTVIPFGYGGRELHINTSKRGYGGLSSTAHAWTRTTDNTLTCVLFQDFNTTLEKDPKARCTEKTIRTMHAKALEGIDDVLAAAKAQHPPQAASTETPIEAIRFDLGALDELPEERWARNDPKLSSAEEADEAMSDFNCRASPMHY